MKIVSQKKRRKEKAKETKQTTTTKREVAIKRAVRIHSSPTVFIFSRAVSSFLTNALFHSSSISNISP